MKNIYLIAKILRNMKIDMMNNLNKINLIKDPLCQMKKTCKLLSDIDNIAIKMYNEHLENGCLMGDLMNYKRWLYNACMPFNKH